MYMLYSRGHTIKTIVLILTPWREPQLPTNNSSIISIKEIVTYCTPLTIVTHFNPSLVWGAAVNKTEVSLLSSRANWHEIHKIIKGMNNKETIKC